MINANTDMPSKSVTRPALPTYEEHVSKYFGNNGLRCQSSAGELAPSISRRQPASRTPAVSRTGTPAYRTQSAAFVADSVNNADRNELSFADWHPLSGDDGQLLKPPKPPRKSKNEDVGFPFIAHQSVSRFGSCGYFPDLMQFPHNGSRIHSVYSDYKRHSLLDKIGSTPDLAVNRRKNLPNSDKGKGESSPLTESRVGQTSNGILHCIPTLTTLPSSDSDGSLNENSSIYSLTQQPPVAIVQSVESGYPAALDLGRPSSATSLFGNMSESYRCRIRTNGSLAVRQQTLQIHTQTPPLNASNASKFTADLKECRASYKADQVDNESLASMSSSITSEPDSGIATGHHSGDGSASHHDETLCTIDHLSERADIISPVKTVSSCGSWNRRRDEEKTPKSLPWSEKDISRVIESSRLRSLKDTCLLSPDAISYLSRLLRHPFASICAEVGRLAKSNYNRCTKRDVLFAAQRVLPSQLLQNCKTACVQAAVFYMSVGPSDQLKASKSDHCGLGLDVGRIAGHLIREKVVDMIQELAVVHIVAVIQTVLEELLLACMKSSNEQVQGSVNREITRYLIERTIRSSAELSRLFKPLSDRYDVPSSNASPTSDSPCSDPTRMSSMEDVLFSVASCTDQIEGDRKDRCRNGVSSDELTIGQMHWSMDALLALQHFFNNLKRPLDDHVAPLTEWLRVIEACAAYRRSTMIEKNDVMEAARVLVSFGDYPVSVLGIADELQYFQAISKPRFLNEVNQAGLTPLMVACIRCDYQVVKSLIAAGAKVNLAITPPPQLPSSTAAGPRTANFSRIRPDIHNWTALHFAVAHGSPTVTKYLLDNGAHVEGSDWNSVEISPDQKGKIFCETPLQIAAGQGNEDIVSLLLSRGADPCFVPGDQLEETEDRNKRSLVSMCPFVIAAAHGRRNCLRRMLPVVTKYAEKEDSVSLEEALLDGSFAGMTTKSPDHKRQSLSNLSGRMSYMSPTNAPRSLSTEKLNILNSALYHAVENGFGEVAQDLHHAGAVWKVHTWSRALTTELFPSDHPFLALFLEAFCTLNRDELIESTDLIDGVIPSLFRLMNQSRGNVNIVMIIARVVSALHGADQLYVTVSTAKAAALCQSYRTLQGAPDSVLEKSCLNGVLRSLPRLLAEDLHLMDEFLFVEAEVLRKSEACLIENVTQRRKVLGQRMHGSV